VYFALASIIGNTFVSEAAARTVGAPAEAAVLVEGELVAAAAALDVVVELVFDELLPQPAINSANPAARPTNGLVRWAKIRAQY
jgi:hypothetical protein